MAPARVPHARRPVTLLRFAAIVSGTVALILIGVLVVGILLPGNWTVERSILIQAPPDAIYPHLARASAWDDWTPGPESGYEFVGPDEGEGSGRTWDDPGYGQGRFEIMETDPPRRVRYTVEVEDGAIRIQGDLRLTPEEEGTRVTWQEVGDFGWNPLLGFLAGRMEDMQGAQLEASLASLRALVEGEAREEVPMPPSAFGGATGSPG
jgi:uncharacterized protein YndB with AHSA1/START domain